MRRLGSVSTAAWMIGIQLRLQHSGGGMGESKFGMKPGRKNEYENAFHGHEQYDWASAEKVRRDARIESSSARVEVVEQAVREDTTFIGIDLGTTNSCISYIDKNTLKPKIIPSPTGSWVFPTAVTFDRNHNRRTFGEEARANLRVSTNASLSSGKRLIGRKYGEMGRVHSHMSKTNIISMNERGEMAVELAGKSYSVVHVTGMFLRYLKQEAEKFLGEPVDEVVVSVPADFSPQQKVATEDAALIAGFDVLEVIDEPTAACLTSTVLADDMSHKRKVTRSLVFDLGGGTLDCAVMEHDHRSDEFVLIATHGDPLLGGNDWDNQLTGTMMSQFKKKWGVDLESPFNNNHHYSDIRTLQWEAEKAKIHFTNSVEPYHGYVRAFHFSEPHRDLLPLEVDFTLEEYLDLTRPLRAKCIECVKVLLDNIGIRPEEIDRVLLVGAMTRDPPLRSDLEGFFGKPVQSEDCCPADYAVAIGAAVRGGMLRGMYPKLTSHTQFVLGTTQDKSVGNPVVRAWRTMKARALLATANPNVVGKKWRGDVLGLPNDEIVKYARELVEFEAKQQRRDKLDTLEAEANEIMKRVVRDSSRRQGQQEKRVNQLTEQLKFWQYMVHNFHDHEEHLETIIAQLTSYMDELEGKYEDEATDSSEINEDGTINFGESSGDGPKKLLRRELPLPRSDTKEMDGISQYGHPGLAEAAQAVEGGVSITESTRDQMFQTTISDRAWREPPAPPQESGSWNDVEATSSGDNASTMMPADSLRRALTLEEQMHTLMEHYPIDPLSIEAQADRDVTYSLGCMVVEQVINETPAAEGDNTASASGEAVAQEAE